MQGLLGVGGTLKGAARHKAEMAMWFKLEEQMEERKVWETSGPGNVLEHHTYSLKKTNDRSTVHREILPRESTFKCLWD